MINYTFEVYRVDRRTKDGIRMMRVFDADLKDMATAETIARDFEEKIKGTVVKVFQTFVTKTNLQSGKEFQERYDTPYFCSPSSDAYWD